MEKKDVATFLGVKFVTKSLERELVVKLLTKTKNVTAFQESFVNSTHQDKSAVTFLTLKMFVSRFLVSVVKMYQESVVKIFQTKFAKQQKTAWPVKTYLNTTKFVKMSKRLPMCC